MSLSVAQIRKNRKSRFENTRQKMEEDGKPKYEQDERYWKPTLDNKTKKGSAVVRFLPAPVGEDVDFVKLEEYGFQGPTGRYYIEKSLRTIGRSDPVLDHDSKLWATAKKNNDEGLQAKLRKRLSKTRYIMNVYVVEDPANPENEGKVFLYKAPKTIFEIIEKAMNPEYEEDEPIDPFDPVEGANFSIRAGINKGGFWDYSDSKFLKVTKLAKTDKELVSICEQAHSLKDEISEEKFKSYEDLEIKFLKTIGEDDEVEETSNRPTSSRRKATRKKAAAEEDKEVEDIEDDEDDDLEFSDEEIDELMEEVDA